MMWDLEKVLEDELKHVSGKRLSDEQEKLFAYFTSVHGMNQQLSQFLEDEDIKTLLEQGGLTRMAGRFSKGYGELSALYEKVPTLLLDSFPRSYPGPCA